MPVDDLSDVRQADPGAWKFIRPVQSLKDAEQLPGVIRIKADAVVADKDHDLGSVAGQAAEFDFR